MFAYILSDNKNSPSVVHKETRVQNNMTEDRDRDSQVFLKATVNLGQGSYEATMRSD